MVDAYFVVWHDPKKRGHWRHTYWQTGRRLLESSRAYVNQTAAVRAIRRLKFASLPPIYDVEGNEL